MPRTSRRARGRTASAASFFRGVVRVQRDVRLLLILMMFAGCHAVERPVVLRSAELQIVTDDTAAALGVVARSVESVGGEVVESEAWREDGRLRACVVLRVPQGELMRTLEAIRREAVRVERERVGPRGAGVPPAVTPASRLQPMASPISPPSLDSSRHSEWSLRDPRDP